MDAGILVSAKARLQTTFSMSVRHVEKVKSGDSLLPSS